MSRRNLPAAGFAALLLPFPAAAHHAMGGGVAQTLWQGFASGLAHPVLGLDHLAFLLAAGVLAATLPHRGGRALLAFLAAGLAGALLHLGGVGLGPVEAMVAASVLLVGVALLSPAAWRRPAMAPAWIAAGFAVAGLFHGHAFAEAVAGARPAVLAAHLLALAIAQAAIGFGAMAVARRAMAARPAAPLPLRLAGGMAVAVGLAALTGAVLA